MFARPVAAGRGDAMLHPFGHELRMGLGERASELIPAYNTWVRKSPSRMNSTLAWCVGRSRAVALPRSTTCTLQRSMEGGQPGEQRLAPRRKAVAHRRRRDPQALQHSGLRRASRRAKHALRLRPDQWQSVLPPSCDSRRKPRRQTSHHIRIANPASTCGRRRPVSAISEFAAALRGRNRR